MPSPSSVSSSDENRQTADELYTTAECGLNVAVNLQDCLGEREAEEGEISKPSGTFQLKSIGTLLKCEIKSSERRVDQKYVPPIPDI